MGTLNPLFRDGKGRSHETGQACDDLLSNTQGKSITATQSLPASDGPSVIHGHSLYPHSGICGRLASALPGMPTRYARRRDCNCSLDRPEKVLVLGEDAVDKQKDPHFSTATYPIVDPKAGI